MKKLLMLATLLTLTACGGRQATEQTQQVKQHNGITIVINSHIPYKDPTMISTAIRQECTDLGKQLSTYVAEYSAQNGINIIRENDINNITEGYVLDIKITQAISIGNAFTGHKKQVNILANLQKDGENLDLLNTHRDSMGGFLGGFKGSCSVLDRTVKALGKDTAIWLNRNL